MDAWSFSRVIWVEVSGLPPSACSSSNMKNIGNLWGSVIGFDERTIRRRAFGVARMLLCTCLKESI